MRGSRELAMSEKAVVRARVSQEVKREATEVLAEMALPSPTGCA
jgi:antitoxin component of RelBE/YafQ-DinJ toxin-antitoxin module